MPSLLRKTKEEIKRISKLFGIDISYMRMEKAFRDQKKLVSNRQSPIIFDGGANKGQTTSKYLNLHQNSKILAFEPFPEIFQIYTNRIISDRVRAYCVALSDTDGQEEFFSNKNHYTNSLLETDREGEDRNDAFKNLKKLKVKTIKIDTFCRENGIAQIDILKLDIQGGELKALNGAEEMLRDKKINLIYSEVWWLVGDYKGQPLFEDIEKYLSKVGYNLYGLYNVDHDFAGQKTQGDAIFIPERL